ncbi:HlyD family efflux transporter periplasmic adaptor subunit [Flaviaesturariibacter flavus]|uniref:HlyD family efflux transporter periplasmic adaptor subunit n=1 Tax=Flaviaesturariibacter flavus TaxID=2502780 RepID=A0A4R1B575_9BACT|nr:HlyD family efflux transporter periplasmic adaptor subunit [Flaviaesturariibacter flavus]TCJ13121.1 HlyD family efflux transporter periplasmic adaptor subunit [Flaviaesturariibacter flavus]
MYQLRYYLFAAAFLLSACGKQVEKIYPREEPITESVYASGTVKSSDQYDVAATVTGVVQQVLVDEGDLVREGQPLFVLAQEAPRLLAENARINAEYGDAARNADRLAELRTSIDAARARLGTDSALYARQRALWADGIGTRNELDARELAWRQSRDAYRASQSRYTQLQRQVTQSERTTQTTAALSRAQLADYTIRSRMAGRVYAVNRKKGELVGPQVPLAVIGGNNNFLLELQVDEFDIARIRQGQTVLVQLDSYKGQVFEATVSKIDPLMNERTRTFKVEATFRTLPPQLYPNLTVEANIVLQSKPKALTIPRGYMVDDNHVLLANKEKRAVQTGVSDYQRVEITGGLRKDEAIIKPTP